MTNIGNDHTLFPPPENKSDPSDEVTTIILDNSSSSTTPPPQPIQTAPIPSKSLPSINSCDSPTFESENSKKRELEKDDTSQKSKILDRGMAFLSNNRTTLQRVFDFAYQRDLKVGSSFVFYFQ